MCKGVRTEFKDGHERKGLPEGLSYQTNGSNWLYITEDKDEPNTATLEEALRWAKNGSKITYDNTGTPKYVEHPDWHSHSWLTTTEFEDCINKVATRGINWEITDYKALLSCMKTFEDSEYDCRIVFWFDN